MNNDEDKIGIACPKCGCRELRVITTRKSQTCILRYRVCRYCGHHLTTRERVIQ